MSKFYFKGNKTHEVSLCALYSKKFNAYYVPANAESLLRLWKEYTNTKSIQLDEQEFKKVWEKVVSHRVHLEDIEKSSVIVDDRLRDYQNKDVYKMVNLLENPPIFNAPRTGKTPTTLIYIREKNFKRVLLAVPPSVVLVWREEVKKWLGREAILIHGSLAKRKAIYDSLKELEEYIAIVSYDTLKSAKDTNMAMFKYDLFGVDEAHFLRNKDTQRSKAIRTVGMLAKNRVALTGTPSVRHASDVWHIFNFLDRGNYPSYWNFVYRYFHMDSDYFTGADVPSELKEEYSKEFLNMIKENTVQRKMREVVDWLPPVIKYPLVVLDFERKQAKQYKDMFKELCAVSEDGETVVDTPNQLSKIMRLRQIALDPELIGLDGGSPKTEWLLDYVRDNPDEPIIIFSNFTSYLNKLHSMIPNSTLYTGQQSKEEKFANQKAFQNGDVNVILVNVTAGQMGITLDRAETEIYADYVWSPDVLEQTEARFLPTTKERVGPRGIYYLFIKGSIDFHMMDRTNIKAKSADYVNNVAQALLKMKEEEN